MAAGRIGHPWLSVRYESPHLLIAGPHESEPPLAEWAVDPGELAAAVASAETELERFASVAAAFLPLLGFNGDPVPAGRRLAGLTG